MGINFSFINNIFSKCSLVVITTVLKGNMRASKQSLKQISKNTKLKNIIVQGQGKNKPQFLFFI